MNCVLIAWQRISSGAKLFLAMQSVEDYFMRGVTGTFSDYRDLTLIQSISLGADLEAHL